MRDLRQVTPMRRKVFSVGVGLTLVVGASSHASWADTQSLLSSADAYVQGGAFANRNFGADLDLQSKFASATSGISFSRKDYIQFDLAPAVGNVLSSSLALTVSDALIGAVGNPAQVYTFHVYGLNDGAGENWVEGTGTSAAPSAAGITWNNAPANNLASGNAVTALATSLGTFTLTGRGTAGQQINFVSAALTAFLNADTNNLATVIITRDTQEPNNANSVVHAFDSRQSGVTGPTLTITTPTPAPEPSVLALMGVGCWVLCASRKMGIGAIRRRAV